MERDGRKRIQSGSVDWGYSFKVGKHQWNVVEAIGGSLEVEKVELPRDPEEERQVQPRNVIFPLVFWMLLSGFAVTVFIYYFDEFFLPLFYFLMWLVLAMGRG